MRRLLQTLLALSTLVLAPASAAHGQISFGIHIGEPPAPRAYRVPPRPGPDYMWVEGYQYPEGGRYKWHDGYWTRPPYDERVLGRALSRRQSVFRWALGRRTWLRRPQSSLGSRQTAGPESQSERQRSPRQSPLTSSMRTEFFESERTRCRKQIAGSPVCPRRNVGALRAWGARPRTKKAERTNGQRRKRARRGGRAARRSFRTAGTGAGESRNRPVSVSRCLNYSRSPGSTALLDPHHGGRPVFDTHADRHVVSCPYCGHVFWWRVSHQV